MSFRQQDAIKTFIGKIDKISIFQSYPIDHQELLCYKCIMRQNMVKKDETQEKILS